MLKEYLNGDYDIENSYVIGDRLTDVKLAENLGCKAILIAADRSQKVSEVCALITSDWEEIYIFLSKPLRTAIVKRTTKETDILIELNLDGQPFEGSKPSKGSVMLHNLRQQNQKAPGQPNFCLSDYIAPKISGKEDYIGGFAITSGIGIDEHVARFEKDHDDYNAILLKALADRFAEAFAERMHERVRKDFWGYDTSETLDNQQLINEDYKGIRPAPGYPACPDHTEKATLWELLKPEQNAGITITESFAMFPTAAVSGWYFSHPDSKYFGLGQISKDQVEDYAERKGMGLEEAERWLAPVLNYDV